MSSDTPRTDEKEERVEVVEYPNYGPPYTVGKYVVEADFARTLERDLSEALAVLREARDVMVEHMPHKIPTVKCPVCNVADRIDALLAKERA